MEDKKKTFSIRNILSKVVVSKTGKRFGEVGDLVFEDTIVCIIEAMKFLNEVRANKKGVINTAIVLDNNAQLAGLRKQVKKIYNKIV